MRTRITFLTFILIFSLSGVFAQEDSTKCKLSSKVTADFVSSYIWRGTIADASMAPNIQPTLALVCGNFEVGMWGSYNVLGTYRETDLYLSYTLKGFSVCIYDYFWNLEKPYFEYGNETGHIIDGVLCYKISEKFPLKVTVASMFYGDDKVAELKDTNTIEYLNQYSTYAEIAYSASLEDYNFDFAIGGTPVEGFYGTEPGITNVSITGYRSMKITDSYSLPIKASLIANPLANKLFFVFGITF